MTGRTILAGCKQTANHDRAHRIVLRLISGIGFLGAGAILFLRQEVIRGLTTVACLRTIAAVGPAVGGGLDVAAAATTLAALIILALVRPLERRIVKRQSSGQLTIVVDQRSTSLQPIETIVEKLGAHIAELTVVRGDNGGHDSVRFSFVRDIDKTKRLAMTIELRAVEGVHEIRM